MEVITAKCEEFFSQAAGSPSVPTLRSELSVVIQNMNQVYSMSSIYIDKYVIGHLPSHVLAYNLLFKINKDISKNNIDYTFFTYMKEYPLNKNRLINTYVLNVVIDGSVNSRLLFFRLKTVNLVLRNTQGAESLVKLYETKLCEEEAVTADKNSIENLMGTLKVRVSWCLFMGK